MVFALVLAVPLLVAAAFAASALKKPSVAARISRNLPKSHRMALPEWLAADVNSRYASQSRWLAIGAGVGVALSVAISALLHVGPFDTAGLVLIVGGMLLGSLAATWAWMVVEARRRATSDLAIQRDHGVRLWDYVGPIGFATAAILIVAGVVVISTFVQAAPYFTPMVDKDIVAVGVFLIGPIGAIVSLILIAVTSALPQRAFNAEQLAWDDAIFSQAILTPFYLAPLSTAITSGMAYSAIMRAMPYGTGGEAIRDSLFGYGILGAVVLMAASIVYVASMQHRYYLTRLWPTLR